MAKFFSIFIGFLILIPVFVLYVARRSVTDPINKISKAANARTYDTKESRRETLNSISKLDIRTGDEIEKLYISIKKSTEDMVRYIEESLKKSLQISRLQNGLILVLADIVENRDKCTGDHIKKTLHTPR